MTYAEILSQFEVYKNDPILTNQKIKFGGYSVYAEFKVRGEFHQTRLICHVYAPTAKGYKSSKWEKNPLSKMDVEFTKDVYNMIAEFIQSNQPNHFVKPHERGENIANVLANHLRGSDPYDIS